MKKRIPVFALLLLLYFRPSPGLGFDFAVVYPLRDVVTCADLVIEIQANRSHKNEFSKIEILNILKGKVSDTLWLESTAAYRSGRGDDEDMYRFLFIRNGTADSWEMACNDTLRGLPWIVSNTVYTFSRQDAAVFRKWVAGWVKLQGRTDDAVFEHLLAGIESPLEDIRQDAVFTLNGAVFDAREIPRFCSYDMSDQLYSYDTLSWKINNSKLLIDWAHTGPLVRQHLSTLVAQEGAFGAFPELANAAILLQVEGLAPIFLDSATREAQYANQLIKRIIAGGHGQDVGHPDWDEAERLLVQAASHCLWVYHVPDATAADKHRAACLLLYLLELNRSQGLYDVRYGMLLENGSLLSGLNTRVPGTGNRPFNESLFFSLNWTQQSQRTGVSVAEMNQQCLTLLRQIGDALNVCEDPVIQSFTKDQSWEICPD